MAIIAEPDSSQLELLHGAVPGSTAYSSMKTADEHVRANPQEAAVVVGPSISLDEAAMLAQWARIHRPALGVILLRHRVDSTVLTEALRSGMREVVEARDLTGVAAAVQRANVVAEAMLQSREGGAGAATSTGKVITVFSTKGGVGKSLVATNLATALADAEQRVCLVDLDIHSGDVAIMLQLNPTHQLNDLSAFGGMIDEGAASSILTHYSDQLAVVAAPIKIDSPDQATPEAVGKLLEQLRSMFDLVVVDTSGIFDDHALVALDRTDVLVLVGTLDIPALKNLKVASGTLDLLNFPRDRRRLVLNRADAKVGLSVKEFEDTLGLSADCTLVSSREVLAAVNRGEPIVQAQPSHPNSKAIVSFAKTLVAPATLTSSEDGATGARKAPTPRRRRLRKVT